jgi:predicted phage-related endonuclease
MSNTIGSSPTLTLLANRMAKLFWSSARTTTLPPALSLTLLASVLQQTWHSLSHEAAVFGVDMVYLAVLFGGQEFVLIPFTITDEQKEELIKQMAVIWGHVKAGTHLPPEDVEQVKLLYPVSTEEVKTASASVEQACLALAQIKANIKALEAQEEQYDTLVRGYMQDKGTLATH